MMLQVLSRPGKKLILPTLRALHATIDISSPVEGVRLANHDAVMPCIGFAANPKSGAFEPTLNALKAGFRCVDTVQPATEQEVGSAIHKAVAEGILSSRDDVFVITKQWWEQKESHNLLESLFLSLQRLGTSHVDMLVMDWQEPASSLNQASMGAEGPWYYHSLVQEQMATARAETWSAMETAMELGMTKSIGVSNFSVKNLKVLKKTARVWPPAINQVEFDPLFPRNDVKEYCNKEGIALQYYGAPQGLSKTAATRKQQFGETTLLQSREVSQLAQDLSVTNAQVVVRYALQRHGAITTDALCAEQLQENANVFHFDLTESQLQTIDSLRPCVDEPIQSWSLFRRAA